MAVGERQQLVVGDGIGCESIDIVRHGIGSQGMVETVQLFIETVTCHIGGLLKACRQLLATLGDVGIEHRLRDKRSVIHFAYERKQVFRISA